MNKIYLDPISKADALAEGIRKQADVLAKSGIVIDAEKLSAACRALEHAGTLQDEAEARLKDARDAAYVALEELKDIFTASKMPIKQSFAPEQWPLFGLQDKK